jgi:hypothetical protein
MSTDEILQDATPYFVGVELSDGYVGTEIRRDHDDVVLLCTEAFSNDLLGFRFPYPDLPQEGWAYRGVAQRTPRDWILDLRIVLMEELDTGLARSGERTPRGGWWELRVPPEHWPKSDPDTPIGEWADP